MLKLEGVHPEIVTLLVTHGVPVCGHLGLLPQSINQLGAYKVCGKEQAEADKILADAQRLEQAGISVLILECVPTELAKRISVAVKIPVIGIGAGVECDGQVLVLYDMLGITKGKSPSFSKNFLIGQDSIQTALQNFVAAVKNKTFPDLEHSFN